MTLNGLEWSTEGGATLVKICGTTMYVFKSQKREKNKPQMSRRFGRDRKRSHITPQTEGWGKKKGGGTPDD